jgi:hypothetical protein
MTHRTTPVIHPGLTPSQATIRCLSGLDTMSSVRRSPDKNPRGARAKAARVQTTIAHSPPSG